MNILISMKILLVTVMSDCGKTFGKTIMLSAPNNGHTVDQNVQLAASGSNVYGTWWTQQDRDSYASIQSQQ
jgi:hypothetical protein